MTLLDVITDLWKDEIARKTCKRIFIGILLLVALATLIFAGDIVRVFVITIGALYLFTTERLPVDLTAITIMVTLMIFGLVSPAEGVSGFSNSATITVMAMFVISAAIQKTGIIHTLGRMVFQFAGKNEFRQLLCIAAIIGPISGVINNTAAVAIMLPMVLDLTRRAKTSATKLLIPLSFISMAGGMLTLIGTSTNILASSILEEHEHFEPLGMFEFSKLGIIVLGITILFFLVIGRFLLPQKRKNEKTSELDAIESDFLIEIILQKGSRLIGKTLKNSKFLSKHDVKLVKLIRGKSAYLKDAMEKELKEGDVLMLMANQQRIIDLDNNEKDDIKLLLDFDESRRKLPGSGQIVKVLVRASNVFRQRSLASIKFWKRFGAAVVGVHREDVSAKRLADMKLDAGEILLVKASRTALAELQRSDDLMIVESIDGEFNREKMWIAISIVFGVIAVAALGFLPIMVSALAGVVLLILTGCLDPSDLHRSVSWDVIFLLAGVIPLGIAMQTSGAADMIAEFLAESANFLPPILILGLFYVMTTIITEIVSNNASVVLLIPVAISVAEKLFLNPKAFVLAVMFAASTSFLTPVGYQTNTMVFGVGNYKFSDFIKVGAPLNALLAIITTLLITYFWGLDAIVEISEVTS